MIAIIMGSDSDLPVMSAAAETCREFDTPHHVTVVSAHRTPERMFSWARSARENGYSVVIAGAGGAAHLPGMVAAMTSLPVIGVPIQTGGLNGLDSLLSIVQMPRGVPVATVAINNSRNAALLALRILAVHDAGMMQKLDSFLERQKDEVLEKASSLESVGWKRYLSGDTHG